MKNYLDLMRKVIREGSEKSGTFSLFGQSLEFNLADSFPLLTSRKIYYKGAFAELACFLKGTTEITDFNERGVNFWDADCNKPSWNNNPNKQSPTDMGKIYGYQWRYGFGFDQIQKLKLNIRKNPTSRRHVLITYNPKDLDSMCLPPCYVSHQFYSDGKTLDMLVHQRSADLCLGVPFDIASFALFQTLMAKETRLKPGKLKVIFGDVHIYREHLPGVGEHLKRAPKIVKPQLLLHRRATFNNFEPEMARIDRYIYKDPINYPFVVQS